MKHYIYNKYKTFDIFQYKIKNPFNSDSGFFGQIINEFCLGDFKNNSDVEKFIYETFSSVKIKHKNSEWVWDEHYEHYPLDEIVLFLEKVWKDLDIKKELMVITSDIHADYSHLSSQFDFYFTLHNMRLHHRRPDFTAKYEGNCKYKFFLQGGSLRQDRTYIGDEFKKIIPNEFYASTISDNPFNQGADSSGKMKYTYSQMFNLMDASHIMFVNETIRPGGDYFYDTFKGTETRVRTGYTEKTGNAILFKKPFFLNSNPYSLYNLRELGFKTFGEVWDESYDEKPNQKDRIDGIMNNIKWLSKIGDGGFAKVARKFKEITEHNYKHLTEEMTIYDGMKLYKPSEFNFKI